MRRVFWYGGVGGVALMLLLAAVACGKTNRTATPASTASAVPTGTRASLSGRGMVSSPTPRAAGAAQVSPAALSADGAQVLKEVATDNKYSVTSYTAKANRDIALTLGNDGQAVHNWHLLDVKDADGKEIKTSLLAPGKSETVVFKITHPGTYHFHCDVHPAEMKGTLTITP